MVNLYPGNEGYSLLLKGRTGADSETMRLPYEESELLNYIDAEQLPPLLVDLLDKVQVIFVHMFLELEFETVCEYKYNNII